MKKSLILLGLLGLQQAFAQTGKVGINTDNPSATLNVKSKTGTTNATKNLELENANGTKLVTILDDGKVGIGAENPQYRLDINPSGGEYYDNSIALRNFRANNGGNGFDFYKANGTKAAPQAVGLNAFVGGFNFFAYTGTKYKNNARITVKVADEGAISADSLPVDMRFETTTIDNKTNSIMFRHTGNVGIGLNNPLAKLEVAGDIKIGTKYGTSTITNNATTPVPAGGAGTIIFQNGHFFGWTGTHWKQLDN